MGELIYMCTPIDSLTKIYVQEIYLNEADICGSEHSANDSARGIVAFTASILPLI